MSTKETILRYLSYGPQTSYALGMATNAPQPSVRRTIGSLRADGFDITTRGTGMRAEYTLMESRMVPSRAFSTTVEGDVYRGPNGEEG